jgi:hypothetical protein
LLIAAKSRTSFFTTATLVDVHVLAGLSKYGFHLINSSGSHDKVSDPNPPSSALPVVLLLLSIPIAYNPTRCRVGHKRQRLVMVKATRETSQQQADKPAQPKESASPVMLSTGDAGEEAAISTHTSTTIH